MVAAPGHSSLSYKLIAIVWAIWQGITVYIGVCCVQAGVFTLPMLAILAVMSLVGTGFALRYLFSYPTVTFDEEGVHWQVTCVRRFYPWADLTAVGTLYVKNKIGNIPSLVVAKPGGKPWDGDPGSFRFYNRGKLIFVPYSDDLADYAEEYYGDLDFTLVRR